MADPKPLHHCVYSSIHDPAEKLLPTRLFQKLINFKQLNTLKFHKTLINKSYPRVNNYFKPVIAPDTQLDELELTTKFKNKLPGNITLCNGYSKLPQKIISILPKKLFKKNLSFLYIYLIFNNQSINKFFKFPMDIKFRYYKTPHTIFFFYKQ